MKKLAVMVCVLLALLSAAAAVIYFTKTAGDLPRYLPGYAQGSVHKHVKHGIAFAGLGIVFLIGAWMATGHSPDKAVSEQKAEQ